MTIDDVVWSAMGGSLKVLGEWVDRPYRASSLPRVREYSTPTSYEAPATGNLTDAVADRARDHPAAVVMTRRTPGGWEDVTARDFHDQVSNGRLYTSDGADDLL